MGDFKGPGQWRTQAVKAQAGVALWPDDDVDVSTDAANPYHDDDGKFTHGPGGPSKVGGHTKSGMKLSALGRYGEDQFVKHQDVSGVSEVFGKVRATPKTAQGQNPIDIESDEWAIEVKTIDTRSKRLRVSMKPGEVARKAEAAAKMGKKGAVVAQLLDHETGTMHVFAFTEGFRRGDMKGGSFDVPVTMEVIGQYTAEAATTAAAGPGDEDFYGNTIEPGDTVISFEMVDGEWTAVIEDIPGDDR